MSGTNIERVTTVLVEAFASQNDLERMARFALDIALDEKILSLIHISEPTRPY